MQRIPRHEDRRQVVNLLNGIGNIAASFLDIPNVTVPTAISTTIPTIPSIKPAPPTSRTTTSTSTSTSTSTTTSNVQSSAQTSRVPSSTASSTTPTPISSSTAGPTSSLSTFSPTATPSSQSPKSSTGLIAGAVIGSIAVLILLAIFIMLCLRHKRKKRQTPPAHTRSPTLENGPRQSLDETLVERTPLTEHPVPVAASGPGYAGHDSHPVGGYMHNEKDVYRSTHQALPTPMQNEMETSANVWELDGQETSRPLPTELKPPVTEQTTTLENQPAARRHDREELHF